jgi:MerR family transcriptional regulator, light-induced transcriptional regulator
LKGLAIKDVAERTGLAPGTIRMWEQRYGVPEPQRSGSGYRIYTVDDVELLRRAIAFRSRGLSVPAALDRARTFSGPTDRPSIYGAIATADLPVRSQLLRKRTLIAISHAIEDETIARAAGPVVFGAFQHERNYRHEEHRYRRLAERADTAVVFADFPEPRLDADPVEIPIAPEAALGNEWAVIVDAPGFAACLLAWERPRTPVEERLLPERERRFESLWTMDPSVVRRAALVGASLMRDAAPEIAGRVERVLSDRPLAVEAPAPGLTALTNRLVGYLEA